MTTKAAKPSINRFIANTVGINASIAFTLGFIRPIAFMNSPKATISKASEPNALTNVATSMNFITIAKVTKPSINKFIANTVGIKANIVRPLILTLLNAFKNKAREYIMTPKADSPLTNDEISMLPKIATTLVIASMADAIAPREIKADASTEPIPFSIFSNKTNCANNTNTDTSPLVRSFPLMDPRILTAIAIMATANEKDMIALRAFSMPLKPLAAFFIKKIPPARTRIMPSNPARPVINSFGESLDKSQTAPANTATAKANFMIASDKSLIRATRPMFRNPPTKSFSALEAFFIFAKVFLILLTIPKTLTIIKVDNIPAADIIKSIALNLLIKESVSILALNHVLKPAKIFLRRSMKLPTFSTVFSGSTFSSPENMPFIDSHILEKVIKSSPTSPPNPKNLRSASAVLLAHSEMGSKYPSSFSSQSVNFVELSKDFDKPVSQSPNAAPIVNKASANGPSTRETIFQRAFPAKLRICHPILKTEKTPDAMDFIFSNTVPNFVA